MPISKKAKIHAILLAAGDSTRTTIHKLWQEVLPNVPVILLTIQTFLQCRHIASITVVCTEEHQTQCERLLELHGIQERVRIVTGGNTRTESVYHALISLKELSKHDDLIAIHNAANPLLSDKDLEKGLEYALEKQYVIFGFPLTNTIKEVEQMESGDIRIVSHPNRAQYFEAQTPQIFPYNNLLSAYGNQKSSAILTDDSTLLASIEKDIYVYQCDYQNIKFTYDHDLLYDYNIGFGEDTHRFARFDKRKPIILGGLTLDEELTIEADSDGDIVLHALYDALSSAIGEKPLGSFADEACAQGSKDSASYIRHILEIMDAHSYTICNVAIHIEAKQPHLKQYHDAIQASIGKLLYMQPNSIGLVYETGDNVSDISRNNGIRCKTHILLRRLHEEC